LAVGLAVALLAACGGGEEPGGGAAPEEETGPAQVGGELVFGQESDINTLDPAGPLGQPADVNVALAIYDTLLSFDAEGELVGDLAESFEVDDTLRTWTLHLREGVTFHDGTPFDAAAVADHWRRIADPAIGSPGQEEVATWQVRTPDARTVVVTLPAPAVAFPQHLTTALGMIPSPTAVAELGDRFGLSPVGTGPFRLVEFTPGSQVVVEKNPDYWKRDDAGQVLPYLDRITFRPIADASARMSALESGDVDMIHSNDASTVPRAEQNPALRVLPAEGSASTFFVMNLRRPPFDDVRARQAVAYAIDRDAIDELLYDGAREPAYAPFEPGSQWLDEDVEYLEHDLDRARELVDELGGLSFTFEHIPTPDSTARAELLQQQWEEAGMDVELATREQAALVSHIYSGDDWEVASLRNQQIADPDQLYDTLHSNGATNLQGYSNAEVDSALEAGRSTADRGARFEAYSTVQRIIAEEVPGVPFLYQYYANVTSSSVHGVPRARPNLLGAIEVAGVWLDR
jgi:peptide/nickel transport system substrate-binding protein